MDEHFFAAWIFLRKNHVVRALPDTIIDIDGVQARRAETQGYSEPCIKPEQTSAACWNGFATRLRSKASPKRPITICCGGMSPTGTSPPSPPWSPASLIIIKAHHLLEKHVLTKWQLYWKEQLSNWYGMFVHESQYLDPVMRNIEKFLEDTQEFVTGKVFIKLYPYRFELTGIEISTRPYEC